MRLKFFGILLCISLAISLTGCGDKGDGTEKEQTEEQTEEEKKDSEDNTENSTESTGAGTAEEEGGKADDTGEKPLFFISTHSDWNYDGDILRGDHHYGYLHFSHDFGDSHPDLLKQIDKINTEIRDGEKERLENEENTITEWNASHEYDIAPYHDEWNIYVTRSDETYFSVLYESEQDSYVGDLNQYSFKGYTYYTDSGKEIKLSDMLKDEDGFYDELTESIEEHLKESLGDNYMKGDELNKRLREMMDEGTASFVLNPQGVQVWIDSYNLSPECMSTFFFFGDEEDAAYFKDEFTGSVPDEWIMMPMKGATQCYDAEDDGKVDTINVTDQYDLRESGESEEYYITGLNVAVDDDAKVFPAKTGEASDPYDVYLVHKDNKTVLMAFHYEYVNAYINTWSVNGKQIKEADELMGHFAYVPADEQEGTETYVPYYAPNDLSSMDIFLISNDDPEDETEATMALDPDGTFSETGKKSGISGTSKSRTGESTDDNDGEAE